MVNGTDDDISRAERILSDNGIEEYGIYDANDIDDDTYRSTSSINRVDNGEPVRNMGDVERSGVIEPNTTGKVMNTRTDAVEPTVTGDRTITNDPDTIVVEPRDNV